MTAEPKSKHSCISIARVGTTAKIARVKYQFVIAPAALWVAVGATVMNLAEGEAVVVGTPTGLDQLILAGIGHTGRNDEAVLSWILAGRQEGMTHAEMMAGGPWALEADVEQRSCGPEAIQAPECDRLIAARSETEPAGAFVEWLRDSGYVIAERRGAKRDGVRELIPTPYSLENLLAEWKGINLAVVEEERRAILASLAHAHAMSQTEPK